MIPKRELLELRTEWSLGVDVIEKDYILGWLLAGIAKDPELRRPGSSRAEPAFASATTRRTDSLRIWTSPSVDGGPEEPEPLTIIFRRIGEWVREQSGIELVVDDASFRRRRNRRGNPTTQGGIAYRGPNPPPLTPQGEDRHHLRRSSSPINRPSDR